MMKSFNAKETLKPAMPLVGLKPVLVDASLIHGVIEMIWAQFSHVGIWTLTLCQHTQIMDWS